MPQDRCSFESKMTPRTFIVLLDVSVLPFKFMVIGHVSILENKDLRLRLIYF